MKLRKRRDTAEKYGVDIRNINGKYAVHIMSQQCYALNGSTVKDWCDRPEIKPQIIYTQVLLAEGRTL